MNQELCSFSASDCECGSLQRSSSISFCTSSSYWASSSFSQALSCPREYMMSSSSTLNLRYTLSLPHCSTRLQRSEWPRRLKASLKSPIFSLSTFSLCFSMLAKTGSFSFGLFLSRIDSSACSSVATSSAPHSFGDSAAAPSVSCIHPPLSIRKWARMAFRCLLWVCSTSASCLANSCQYSARLAMSFLRARRLATTASLNSSLDSSYWAPYISLTAQKFEVSPVSNFLSLLITVTRAFSSPDFPSSSLECLGETLGEASLERRGETLGEGCFSESFGGLGLKQRKAAKAETPKTAARTLIWLPSSFCLIFSIMNNFMDKATQSTGKGKTGVDMIAHARSKAANSCNQSKAAALRFRCSSNVDN